jgi:hypothetical protein
MMNDLTTLREAWDQPDPPSAAARSAARTALLDAAAGTGTSTPRHLRRPRLGLRLGVAVGTATAVVAGVAGVAHVAHPGAHTTAASPSSAQQILLAAAMTAAAAPASPGTYWHVTTSTTISGNAYSEQTWMRRPVGPGWVLGAKSGNKLLEISPDSMSPSGRGRFWLAGDASLAQLQDLPPAKVSPPAARTAQPVQAGQVTYAELQKLPVSPAALQAWIVALNRTYYRDLGQPVPRAAVFESLNDLVGNVPAPPAVRAAAFRVMASLPGVTTLGPGHGGQRLLITLGAGEHATLVVDTATSHVTDTLTISNGNSATITAGWVSTLPS